MCLIRLKRFSLILFISLFFTACASVPPEVAQAHQKQLEIIQALKVSYIQLVDAYIDQKLEAIEEDLFKSKGVAYLEHWKASFKQVKGRDYREDSDFSILYSDLVVEYLETIQPVEDARNNLKQAIENEFDNIFLVHHSIDEWLKSLKSLEDANKNAINRVLGSAQPGLSLDTIDRSIEVAKNKIKTYLRGEK